MTNTNAILWDETTRDGVAEASEMNWEPGSWPHSFWACVPDSDCPFRFQMGSRQEHHGEFCGYLYYSYAADRIIKVFNT